MIRTVDIEINAANPNLPLAPFQAYVTSPSSVRVRNVPRKIGTWEITSVQLVVNYPDNTSRTAVCKLTAGVWVGTVVGSTSTGTSTNGYAIYASGTDENGYAVTGYVLGKGDVFILATDGTITIGDTTYYVHLVDSQPSAPKKGDLCVIDSVYKIYNGTAWVALGSQTSVSWDDVTDKPSSFTPSTHASTHGSSGTDPITPASIGAEVSGAAASAVSTHDDSSSAHADLFAAKQDAISDLSTIRSGAAAGATAAQPSDVSTAISADVTHAKSISATGVSTACTPDANGNVNVSSLFSSDNTSLVAAVNATIASRCSSLDPATSSIADIINALKGNN